MKIDSQHIDKQQLVHAINAAYDLNIRSITFVPKGEEAFTYIGRTDSSEPYFIRVQLAVSAIQLERVYPIIYALHEQYGLSQVVAPFMTRDNTLVISFHDYIVAVFPYIEGTTLYKQAPSEIDITATAILLARLHQLPRNLLSLRQEDFDNPFRAPILHALNAACTPSVAGTFLQREVCRLFLAERADIMRTLERMEQLQAKAQLLVSNWSLTHGDPNRDNFLKDQRGCLHLTDWGELAIGPAERDLMHWTGDAFEPFLRQYARLRPHLTLHREVFEFYFYRWSMQEIADYATRILFRQLGPTEDEHAWAELQDYLPVQHNGIAEGVQDVQAVINRVLG